MSVRKIKQGSSKQSPFSFFEGHIPCAGVAKCGRNNKIANPRHLNFHVHIKIVHSGIIA